MDVKRIIRNIFLLFLIGAASGAVQAQGPALWEVRDGDATLVIMGSVHLLRPDIHWLNPELERRFDAASRLVLEVGDLQAAEAVMMRFIHEKGFYPPGQSLADELEPATFERALALAESLGAARAEFAQMRPWLAGIILTQLWAASHGYDPGFGVDMVLNQRAARTGKPVIGLESAQEQMEILIHGLGEDAEMIIEQTLTQLEDRDYIDALVTAWLEGDMEVLDRLMREAFADYPEAWEVLIAQRNRNWVVEIGHMLETPGSEFVVVGAAHLVGPDNVLDLLDARGYTVVRR
ncbi:hypothetical protein B1C78_05980 [Thioalkalivibrio denitrificans]|uniref:TraB/GumN family protein n=1 Tax=Thioalkalivibrio denitrificans TaxID=108003 RepID=A0A1V3NKY4_9GAMM|nr:TraB/GumN family protein [Thioalkalivibrio denitrificans]OOG25654.1 hypothetical protein B1C78_05980 [Thioalkalivibrio denitrificans]